MEAFKEIPFMDVDTETGEIVYVGRRYQDVDTWRPPSDLDDQEPTTPSNPSLTHVLAPRMSTPLANAVKRIDDDDGEAGQLSVSASSFSHTARRMDDEDEEEIVMDFHEMMGFSSYGMDTGEAQLSPPDEAGLLVRELKQKKEELSLQLNSRGGVVDSDGDSGRRRMPSYQFIPKVLQDVSRDGGKVVLDLDKNKSQLLFDTNCYVGDLDGVKEMVGLGWSIVVPLAIIMELDGLSASEVEHLAISAGDALGYLEGMFVPGGGKPSNVMLITAQNTVLPFLTIRTEEWGSGVRGWMMCL
ncbi:hypothetical protein BC829DRAFT_210674 [Chytridium lagenaria]|nr:hypothetical protein BC829DRAFT_210674 [Chytridium lagenaria]